MEVDLHQRLVAGDSQALAETYDRFANIIYGMALRVTRDRVAAEDVTQEVFIRLWQRPDQFDPTQGSLRAWLCTISHRRAVDWVRANESQRRRAEQHAQTLQLDDPIEDAIDLSDGAEQAAGLHRALADLPAEQAEAIQLAYFGGRTYRHVAETLGIPEGTAKSRIRLGLQRLGTIIKANPEPASVNT